MPPPPFETTPNPLGVEAYAHLQSEYQQRRRRFLRMVAFRHEDAGKFPTLVPAQRRKYLLDRPVDGEDRSKAWVRLRTPPDPAWANRLTEPIKAEKKDRREKKATVWTDDPVDRDGGLFPPAEEDVNVVVARLLLPRLEAADVMEHDLEGDDAAAPKLPPFPPPIFARMPLPNQREKLKHLLLVLAELGVVQKAGGEKKDKDVKESLFHRIDRVALSTTDAARPPVMVRGEPIAPNDLLGKVKGVAKEFLDKLWAPVDEVKLEERTDFVARWTGVVPGAEPTLLLDHLGLAFAELLLPLAGVGATTPDVEKAVRLLSWLAYAADQPARWALPAISDVFSFAAEPFWVDAVSAWGMTWPDTSFVASAAARPEWLTDDDDMLYRTLTCQRLVADPEALRYFRTEKGSFMPIGWRWPANDPDFGYWWNAVLKRHCADKIVQLDDTADFHANDLLRFCCLFDLFTERPDVYVPPYVAPCIKASLLHFKYWIDEPPATGHKGAEMTFWSENHQIQFHTAEYLAGQLFPTEEFHRSGWDANGARVTGAEHRRRGHERARRWLDRRLLLGFSEFNSPSYYSEDLPPLLNLVDFAADTGLAEKAAMVLDLLIFDLARNTCRGSFGVAAGRAYFEHKCYGWEQALGETLEVLFGSRRDHLHQEKTALALCTSLKYIVPDALLAIGQDRERLDRVQPFEFKNRVSIDLDEARAYGIGFESVDDATFWWGCGGYFAPETLELTRQVADRYLNLRNTSPLSLLFRWDLFGDYLQALILDTAEMAAGGLLSRGASFFIMAPFPLNIAAGGTYIVGVVAMIEGLRNLIHDLAVMIEDTFAAAAALLTGEDPPKPKVPQSALQRAWEAMLMQFNAGNVLSRANLYTYGAGDVMLSSVQNHRASQISFQKQPWIASLGCDACVWTNAPMHPEAAPGKAGWEVFKHLATCQFGRAAGDIGTAFGIGLDDIAAEGLRDWGGSICLPKVAQFRSVAIAAYDFPFQRGAFSETYTHAWFPAEFFDEVSPAPEHDDWLPARGGGGTWVFARKDDGFVALCSARRVRWLRDQRFANDPDPLDPDRTIGQGRFTSTELRADDGSNIWVCAVGTRAQFGSFAAFVALVQQAYLNFSGIGSLGQLQCTFDMPAAAGTGEPGFRWELFYDDDEARVNGRRRPLDEYPRFEGMYVEGRARGRVDWRDSAYRIVHPLTGLWVSHDSLRGRREVSSRLPSQPQPAPTRQPPLRGAVAPRRSSPPGVRQPVTVPSARARRFRLTEPA